METLREPDRRRQTNHVLAVMVDVGVTYHLAFGKAVALAFYKNRAIPDDIVSRVLSSPNDRRVAPADCRPGNLRSVSRSDQELP